MTSTLQELLESMVDTLEIYALNKSGGWTMERNPTGFPMFTDKLIYTLDGHLTPMHTALLKEWVEKIKKELENV
jgi:hypothetical protein